ncbi:TIGR04104 family putative zinc finger protein [Pseudalkalibacillus sp. R45]|uniref:TIGR04104 family putative zinc finger protein n=1 Tax=Pseudalkalibacillus sp. R45 TaxID=3457433 RepID=UPI003FCCB448
MPTCENCNCKWTWKQTFVRQFRFKNKLICPCCNKPQFISAKTRNLSGLFALIPLFLLIPLAIIDITLIDLPNNIIYLTEGITILVVLFIAPYFFKIKSTEEPMW